MVVASRVGILVSARAGPIRFAEPPSMGMASGAGAARYDTRFRSCAVGDGAMPS